MKHTPGPWETDTSAVSSTDIPVCGRTKSGNPRWVARVYGEGTLSRVTDERNANARLIAAAPELLGACHAVLDWAKAPGNHGGNPYCKDFVKAAEAAIRRATKGAL